MTQNILTEEQKTFLKIFERNEDGEELDLTCEMTNVPKSIVEEWSKDYSFFWEKLEDLKDDKKKYLIQLIKKGDAQTCIKFLQIYGKGRGYQQ